MGGVLKVEGSGRRLHRRRGARAEDSAGGALLRPNSNTIKITGSNPDHNLLMIKKALSQ
jgi:hypothetical protein